MHPYTIIVVGITLVPFTLTGCGQAPAAHPQQVAAVAPDFTLTNEPTGAVDILEAKEQAKDGESVVVVGRVGGGASSWVDGRAAFLLVDTALSPSCASDENCDEDCAACTQEMAAAGTMVKFLGENGKVLPIDARELLGVKEHEIVVVRGVAKRDPAGNVSIAADGIFIRR